ncbi:lipase family protein [Nocardioides marmoriginsengisoli]|uniref:lipase family protein n=1 Tax=Nocardioides marmoriginsengisoli TaxID=661483 RepID=UPI0016213770|nr:lipase family protein [Nocardioides marmoriginsengisoli]
MRRLTLVLAVALIAALAGIGVQAAPATAATLPDDDPFYSYTGSEPLGSFAPGTVLKRRVVTHHYVGLPTPLKVTQLLYRTTGTAGEPTVTVATVVPPVFKTFPEPRLVSYQYEYDALGQQCTPSYFFSGGFNLSGGATAGEQSALLGYILSGYTVVVPDYEGTQRHFAAGRESGMNTLDGIRAALNDKSYGLDATTKAAMVGYSGGSIATEWAAELAPSYAPDVNRRLVGAAAGGVPTDLPHNLEYADGSLLWAGAIPLGLVGLARAYDVDLDKYASDYGKKIFARVADQCIVDVLGVYPGLTFAKLMKPQYSSFDKIAEFVTIRKKLVMGQGNPPTTPLFLASAKLDRTGDGIIVTDDVKNLARSYCARGAAVTYHQYTGLEHVGGFAVFIPDALNWISARFRGSPQPGVCARLG